ncbi:hypothetical protein HN385_06605 [archaeon]|jgi:hypothetical protein|nr:hypothetical protein [archaeon]MBT3450734.1 hypothetical protein [archaeon]MBT6869226.1 hypothetical protein [archaeon]MBT7193762.1 hypothetical protein [archaeon]MBT7381409.1 hypothetical protein [archaeon]
MTQYSKKIENQKIDHLPILTVEQCKYFNQQNPKELSDIALVTFKGIEREIYVKGLTYQINSSGQELSLVYKDKDSKMIFPSITFYKSFENYVSLNEN